MTILSDVKQALAGEIETPTNMEQLIGLCHGDLTTDELEIAKKSHPSAFAILEQPVGSITAKEEKAPAIPPVVDPVVSTNPVAESNVVADTKPADTVLPEVTATTEAKTEDVAKVEAPAVVEKKVRVSHKDKAAATSSDTTA